MKKQEKNLQQHTSEGHKINPTNCSKIRADCCTANAPIAVFHTNTENCSFCMIFRIICNVAPTCIFKPNHSIYLTNTPRNHAMNESENLAHDPVTLLTIF